MKNDPKTSCCLAFSIKYSVPSKRCPVEHAVVSLQARIDVCTFGTLRYWTPSFDVVNVQRPLTRYAVYITATLVFCHDVTLPLSSAGCLIIINDPIHIKNTTIKQKLKTEYTFSFVRKKELHVKCTRTSVIEGSAGKGTACKLPALANRSCIWSVSM